MKNNSFLIFILAVYILIIIGCSDNTDHGNLKFTKPADGGTYLGIIICPVYTGADKNIIILPVEHSRHIDLLIHLHNPFQPEWEVRDCYNYKTRSNITQN